MSVGSLEARVLLAAGLAAALLVWDVVLPWVRQALMRRLGVQEEPTSQSQGGEPSAASGGAAADVAAEQKPDGRDAVRDEGPSDGGQTGQKTWEAARELPHSFIPDWSHDADYLKLLYAAASEGADEAMNKLSDYAFRRQAFVEAYYWKLKVEMKGGRCGRTLSRDILSAWLACGCPTQYRNVMRGFSEEQGMFARAVMRMRAGIDVSQAGRRLNMLAKEGNADAQQYLRRSGGTEKREKKS